MCQATSVDSFRCRCQDGFRGQRCELGQVRGHHLAALSPSSILAISMCLLVFLGENWISRFSCNSRSLIDNRKAAAGLPRQRARLGLTQPRDVLSALVFEQP